MLIFLFLAATFSSAVLYLISENRGEIQAFKNQKIDLLDSKYKLVNASHIKVVQSIFSTTITSETILKTFAKAAAISDTDERNTIRRELFDALKDDYVKLQESMGLRQLHFHLPDNESFLRFHRPQKYGDNLTDIRESVRLANETKQFIQGFEEGKIFNGFRYVFPLFYQNEHIGSVELSISFTGLKNLLDQVFDAHYDFILKKSIVADKLFSNERANYQDALSYPGYVREAIETDDVTNVSIAQLQKVKAALKPQLQTYLNTQESFVLHHFCSDSASHCIATFLSVKNLKDEHVAYLVSIEEDESLYRLEREMRLQITALTILFLILPTISYLFFVLKQRKESEIKASTDFLTGALNRFGCQDGFKLLLQEFKEYELVFSVLMFDIDHFKKINDTHGHDVGDIILKELVTLIKEHVREDDIVCRWGGEEFLILLPKANYQKTAKVAQKLLDLVRNYDFTKINKMTISIGFSQIQNGDTIDSVIKRADDCLYDAKDSGRDKAIGH